MPRPVLPRELSLAARLAYVGYNVAGVLAALLCLPASPLLIGRRYREGLSQRLGRIPEAARRLRGPPVWIHTASVGETLAAAPLVFALRRRCPDLPIFMSATTVTGRSVAIAQLQPEVTMLLPVDCLGVVDRVFRRIQPRCLVLVETEFWPGLLRAAAVADTPTVLVSGRVSARSLRLYGWARPLFRYAVGQLAAYGMQTDADAERIVALGACPERVRVTGSLKASREPHGATTPPLAGLDNRRLLIAASTQPGEEAFVLEACTDLWHAHRDMLLLIAPRRPERFDAVAQFVAQTGLRSQRRSAVGDAVGHDLQVLVLDSVGELVRFLPAAWAVFVGGSIAPLGGHNVLEPATFGRAVAFGPHTENVAEAARALCASGGGATVRVPADLARYWGRLLARREVAEAIGDRARRVALAGADVIEHTWGMLAPYVNGTVR